MEIASRASAAVFKKIGAKVYHLVEITSDTINKEYLSHKKEVDFPKQSNTKTVSIQKREQREVNVKTRTNNTEIIKTTPTIADGLVGMLPENLYSAVANCVSFEGESDQNTNNKVVAFFVFSLCSLFFSMYGIVTFFIVHCSEES